MRRWLGFPSVQISLCVAIYAAIGWRMGPFALVIASPLLAAAIARPVLTLLANFRHGVREQTWLPVHGQHYVYKGTTIRVLEDEDFCRWISLADARKIVGITAGEGALVVTYPERCKRMGKPEQPHLRDDALVEHLSKESNPATLRFRTWVERVVALPGRKVRSQRGIRVEPPDA